MSKYGYLRTDGYNCWYLVPENELGDFGKAIDKIEAWSLAYTWEQAVNDFKEKFDKYRLSGGYQDLKILMEDK
jgi:hypothetical protein